MTDQIPVNWNALEDAPPEDWRKVGSQGRECYYCGFPLFSRGGLRVPFLRGHYCSVLCMEGELFGTKKSPCKIGERLLTELKVREPKLYRAVTATPVAPYALAAAEAQV